jgi:hypothetical protein
MEFGVPAQIIALSPSPGGLEPTRVHRPAAQIDAEKLNHYT